jgi:O-antigen ligase
MRRNSPSHVKNARTGTTRSSDAQVFSVEPGQRAQIGFALVAGVFFFVVILKLGNPVILDSLATPPKTFVEAIYESWPLKWGYQLAIPLFACGLLAILARLTSAAIPGEPAAPHQPEKAQPSPLSPRLLWSFLLLPAIWLAWQFVSAAHSVNPSLTRVTLGHFTMSVALFYLGYFALSGVKNPWPLWIGLTLALVWVVHTGLDQHFGGLEATRKMVTSSPEWKNASPDYVKRIQSNRIFSTFMYPNALAGGLLLLLPLSLVFLWFLTPKVPINGRRAFVAILAACSLACLYWSGSKGGWLIALAVGLIALLHSPIPGRWKQKIIAATIILGLLGFAVRYAKFFQRGATSVVARFDYWAVALQSAEAHPLFGTGPGTFSVPYGHWQAAHPKAEMARLTHNDFLEQLSDSGLIGFGAFSVWIIGNLIILYRYSKNFTSPQQIFHFSVWLGLLALFLQSTVEFHLYYPAFAWTTFFLMGWMFSVINS